VDVDSTTVVEFTQFSSGGTTKSCLIDSCWTGMKVLSEARPYVRDAVITNHDYGVDIAYLAIPDLGTYIDEGNNVFANCSQRLVGGAGQYRLTGFEVDAIKNYWGSSTPDTSKISFWVYFNPALSTDPNHPLSVDLDLTEGTPVQTPFPLLAPSPFTGTLSVPLFVERPEVRVVVEVFNILGQRVRTLLNTTGLQGQIQLQWDGRSDQGLQMSSGLYFIRRQVGTEFDTHKVVKVS
jgi:hypothetical protein